MKTKRMMARVLAPVSKTTIEVSSRPMCAFVFNQPKMPAKLMNTVK